MSQIKWNDHYPVVVDVEPEDIPPADDRDWVEDVDPVLEDDPNWDHEPVIIEGSED
jgi:hypothetical protein